MRALAAFACRLMAVPFGIYIDFHLARIHRLIEDDGLYETPHASAHVRLRA